MEASFPKRQARLQGRACEQSRRRGPHTMRGGGEECGNLQFPAEARGVPRASEDGIAAEYHDHVPTYRFLARFRETLRASHRPARPKGNKRLRGGRRGNSVQTLPSLLGGACGCAATRDRREKKLQAKDAASASTNPTAR